MSFNSAPRRMKRTSTVSGSNVYGTLRSPKRAPSLRSIPATDDNPQGAGEDEQTIDGLNKKLEDAYRKIETLETMLGRKLTEEEVNKRGNIVSSARMLHAFEEAKKEAIRKYELEKEKRIQTELERDEIMSQFVHTKELALNELGSDLTSLRQRVQQLDQLNGQLMKTKTRLEDETAGQRSEIAELTAKIENDTALWAVERTEFEALTETLKLKATAVGEVKHELMLMVDKEKQNSTSKEVTISTLQMQIRQLTGEVEELSEELTGARKQIAELSNKCDELASQKGKITKEYAQYEATMKVRLRNSMTQCEEYSEKSDQLQRQQKSTVDAWKEATSKWAQEKEEMQRRQLEAFQSIQTQLRRATQDRDRYHAEWKAMSAQLEDLSQRCEKAEEQKRQATLQRTASEQALQSESQRALAAAAALRAAESRGTVAEESLSVRETALSKAEGQVAELQEERQSLLTALGWHKMQLADFEQVKTEAVKLRAKVEQFNAMEQELAELNATLFNYQEQMIALADESDEMRSLKEALESSYTQCMKERKEAERRERESMNAAQFHERKRRVEEQSRRVAEEDYYREQSLRLALASQIEQSTHAREVLMQDRVDAERQREHQNRHTLEIVGQVHALLASLAGVEAKLANVPDNSLQEDVTSILARKRIISDLLSQGYRHNGGASLSELAQRSPSPLHSFPPGDAAAPASPGSPIITRS